MATNGNDSLVGTSSSEEIDGLYGNDTIRGGSGNDSLLGEQGLDLLYGDAGDDYLNGIYSLDANYFYFLDTNPGDTDTLRGGTGNDFYLVGINDKVVEASGEGRDTVEAMAWTTSTLTAYGNIESLALYLEGTAAINGTGTSLGDTLVGNVAANQLVGNGGNDTLFGAEGNDSIYGGDGADFLDGLSVITSAETDTSGFDRLVGGAGNDSYVVGAGDTVVESTGGGTDTVFANGSYTLAANVEYLVTTASYAVGAGNDLNNKIWSSGNANILMGLGGSDLLSGGDGDDTLIGSSQSLAGLKEIDTLTGGSGSDLFVLGSATGNFYDDGVASNAGRGDFALITDFEVGVDRLKLAGGSSQYYLGASGVSGVSGTGLYQEKGSTDELIAIVKSASSFTIDDLLQTAVMDDPIVGTAENDYLTGTIGRDSISGLGGNDQIVPMQGGGAVDGGDGRDLLVTPPTAAGIVLNAADGTFQVTGQPDENLSFKDIEDLQVTLSPEADTVLGGSGRDQVAFQSYDAVTHGTDLLKGNDGRDWLIFDGASLTPALAFNGSTSTGQASLGGKKAASFDGFADFSVAGTSGNDSIVTGAGYDLVVVGNGRDTADGGAAKDTLVLAGADLYGSNGNVYAGDSAAALSFNATTGKATAGGQTVATFKNFEWYKVHGTTNRDTILGGALGDTLRGDAGNDSIAGGAGDDYLLGGTGSDTLFGDAGNDEIFSGDGGDRLYGGDGNDSLFQDSGHDLLSGDAGDDYLSVCEDLNTVTGGSGNDILDFAFRSDTVAGPLLADFASGKISLRDSKGAFHILSTFTQVENLHAAGTSLNDTFAGGSGNDAFASSGGNDTFSGGAGDDVATTGDGKDTLRGGDGNDQLNGGGGTNFIHGDAGNDVLTASSDSGQTNQLYGDDGDDFITSGASNDTVSGGDGNDQISSGTGSDRVSGGAGNDWVTAGQGNGTLDGSTGTDTLELNAWAYSGSGPLQFAAASGIVKYSSKSYATFKNFENYSITESKGNDSIVTAGGTDFVSMGYGRDTADGGSGVDALTFGANGYSVRGGLLFKASSGSATIGTTRVGTFSGFENYTVFDSSYNDSITTGSSSDEVILENGGLDVADGGAGQDVLDIEQSDANGGMVFNAAVATATIGGAIFLSQRNFEAFQVSSGSYADSIVGGTGADFLFSSAGNDTVFGGGGADFIVGSGGNDKLSGDDGDDQLEGGVGNDSLVGGSGNDVLSIGGSYSFTSDFGRDTLVGGAGADAFDLSARTMAEYRPVDLSAGYTLDESREFSSWQTRNAQTGCAIISDFNKADNDKVVLSGSADNYFLGSTEGLVSGSTAKGLFQRDSAAITDEVDAVLIAVINNGSDFSLASSVTYTG